jgi:hypothetical protein
MFIRKRPKDWKITRRKKNFLSGNIRFEKKICMECPCGNVAYDIGDSY